MEGIPQTNQPEEGSEGLLTIDEWRAKYHDYHSWGSGEVQGGFKERCMGESIDRGMEGVRLDFFGPNENFKDGVLLEVEISDDVPLSVANANELIRQGGVYCNVADGLDKIREAWNAIQSEKK